MVCESCLLLLKKMLRELTLLLRCTRWVWASVEGLERLWIGRRLLHKGTLIHGTTMAIRSLGVDGGVGIHS